MDNIDNFFIRIKTLRNKFIDVITNLDSQGHDLQPVIDLINLNYEQLLQAKVVDQEQTLRLLYKTYAQPLLHSKYLEERNVMNIIDLLSGGSIPNTQNHEHYDPMYLDLVGGRFQGDGMIQPEVIESAVENNTKIGEEERRLISIILTQLVTSDQLAPIWDQLTLIVNCSQSIARKIKLNDDSDRIWVVPDIN